MRGKLLLLLFVPLLLASCATVVSRSSYDMLVFSTEPHAQVQVYDSVYTLPAAIKVKRSNQNLPVRFTTDSLTRNLVILASPQPAFLLNLLWMQAAPAALLIDLTNPKRFHYGKNLFLDPKDTTRVIRPPLLLAYHEYVYQPFPTNKGQINLTLSLPWVNSFYLKPHSESPKRNTGFWGISAGLERYYQDRKFLHLTANGVMDFFVPVPAAVTLEGEHETMRSAYISLTDNLKFNRFSFGYGLNYALNVWDLKNHGGDKDLATRDPVKRSSQVFGITVNTYQQFTKSFCLGIIYRPTIITVAPVTEIKYEHLISLDLAWRIPLRK